MKKEIKRFFAVGMVFLVFGLLSCVSEQEKNKENLAEKEKWKEYWERQAFLTSIDYKNISVEQLNSAIASVTNDGHGFIVQAYVLHPDWMYFYVGSKQPVVETSGKTSIPNGIYLGAQDFDKKFPQTSERLETDRQYTVYIAVLKEDEYGKASEKYNGIVTRIDGLRTVEEVQQKAIKQKEEEKKKAIEEVYKNPVFIGTVASFVREQKENEYSFEAKYKDRIVQLTGVITGFNKGYESYFGITTGRAIYEVSVEGGYCFWFNQDEFPEEVFLRFKKGQNITVVGQVSWGGFLYNGKLDNCRLVK